MHGGWCVRRFFHTAPRVTDKASLDSLQLYLRRFFHTTPLVTDKAFLDSLQLCVQGGSGGKGNAKHGGQGGDGGSVIFKGSDRKGLRGLKRNYANKILKAGARLNHSTTLFFVCNGFAYYLAYCNLT